MSEWQKTLHIHASINNNTNAYFNVEYEKTLKRRLIANIFKLRTNQNIRDWKMGSTDDTKGIKSYYKTNGVTKCYLYGTMQFSYDNIFDYFLYLETGFNNESLWDTQVSGETVKCFDESHQLMYSKGDAGKLLKMMIHNRDLYYMQTRFLLNENGYNIAGSLMYSIDNTHPYYHKKQNNECVRAQITYRGFALLQPEDADGPIEVVYMSVFDVKGDIPNFIVEQQLKSKAVQLLQQFNDSWKDKLNCLMVKRKQNRNNTSFGCNVLKLWLNEIEFTQYYDGFVSYGFDNVYYLRFITKGYLEQIGVTQQNVVCLMEHIDELVKTLPQRIVFGFILSIRSSIDIFYSIPDDMVQCCLSYYNETADFVHVLPVDMSKQKNDQKIRNPTDDPMDYEAIANPTDDL